MGDIIKPLEASSEGLIESVRDSTSAEGMVFSMPMKENRWRLHGKFPCNVLFYSTNTTYQRLYFGLCMRERYSGCSILGHHQKASSRHRIEPTKG